MKEQCPRCRAETDISDDEFIRHLLLNRSYVCQSCRSKFRPAGPNRLVYFLLGMSGLVGAWFAPQLLEMSKTNPNVEVLSISVVVLLTVSAALILRFTRSTKLVEEGNRVDAILHYVSYGTLPISLVAFGAAILLAKYGLI